MTSFRDPRVAQIGRLYEHLAWADAELARGITRSDVPAEAVREYAHIAGAEETWLSRIERRDRTAPVWPEFGATEAITLAKRTAAGFRGLISALNDATLDAPLKYTNSAGKTFATSLGDILLHVAMHGQYHRGKVNLLLRQGRCEPVPVDFIGFVRGIAAAVTPRATGG
jgi:uncharacterized damage-inducible protein DinB